LDEQKLKVALPTEIVYKIDKIIKVLDFPDREEFLITAVRRLVDRYYPLIVGYSDKDETDV